jgi:putative ABC transport system permease protein
MITNYLKIAWKVLLRHRFYTFVTLFGISLTLTVLIVLTSFINHLIGTNYPEYKRDRTLYLQNIALRDSMQQNTNVSPASFEFMQRYVTSLKTPEQVAIATLFNYANAYVNGKRIELKIKHTNTAFWEVAEFNFLEGKPFNEGHIAGGENVAVITDDLKRQYFGDESEPVAGGFIEVDNRKYRVIGVVRGAPITRPFTSADMYIPYSASHKDGRDKGFLGGYVAMVLAADKSDFPAIQSEFAGAVGRIPTPQVSNGGFKFYSIEMGVYPYLDAWLGIFPFLGTKASPLFYAVIALFMFLFMSLPAINLVNLNVSRMMERASEIGVRKAFGAPVRTLMGQFVIENLFVTAIGGAIALVLSGIIVFLINRSGMIVKADLTIDLEVFAASVLICLAFGIMSGLLPALRMARVSIAQALKNA